MKRIGRYEVVRELRAGGMGSVTLGKSPDGQLVVLKRPHTTDADAAIRLRDEARIGARLLHPAIVDTLDLFELESGVPVLVVAYVDGPSLEVLRPLGPLPTGVIARIGRQIAEGLYALHETRDEHGRPLHILHRDVTPGNIVVGRDGDAKLIDLGIARFSERQAEHTQDGFLRGTMRYLAPELLQGDTYSAASDLWALGMVLWEAALGRFAYRGETDREVLAGILRGEPMELEDDERVDEAIVDVIRPLLQLSPVARLSSGAEVAARFAALEERHGDTEALTREVIAAALERKAAKDAEQKARLAHMLLPENLGFPSPMRGHVIGDDSPFADEETAAEVEALSPGAAGAANPFGTMPPTEPLTADEMPNPRRIERRLERELERGLENGFDDGFEHGEKTVSVPAPVSFLVPPLGAPLDDGPAAPPPAPDGASADGSGEDDLDATTPMPTLTVPAEALRSDDADLPERARGFESGEIVPPPVTLAVDEEQVASGEDDDSPTMVTPIPAEVAARRRAEEGTGAPAPAAPPPLAPAPVPLVATAGPAPQLDDDELATMDTRHRSAPASAPVDAPAPPAVPTITTSDAPRPIARIALARKTAAQIEAERQAKANGRPPSIDDLPAARPKPREERVLDTEVTALSPFDPSASQDERAARAARDASDSDHGSDGDSEPRGKGRRRKKRAKGKAAKAKPPVEEAAETTQVSAPPDEADLPSSMFGARMVELPEPQPPAALPSATFASLFQTEAPSPPPVAPPPVAPPPIAPPVSAPTAHSSPVVAAPVVAAPVASAPVAIAEPSPPRPPPKERAAGEVMKLSDVVAFLDDE